MKYTLDDAVGNLLNIYDQYLDESTIYLGADLTGSKLYKNALKKFQALIKESYKKGYIDGGIAELTKDNR